MTITVHKAEIQTATVEVKTLVISGKQMTLSVFRQLPKESIISPDGELAGQVWGRVNYHWGDCSAGLHLHVVWQRGEQLFRSCTYSQGRYGESRMVESVLLSAMLLRAIDGDAGERRRVIEAKSIHDLLLPFYGYPEYPYHLPEGRFSRLKSHLRGSFDSLTDADKREVDRLQANRELLFQTEELMTESYLQFLTRYRASYQVCLDSPQLFIAV